MASLPSAHPTLSLHLADSNLTPLLSSASTSSPTPQSDSLSALTTASLSAYTSATRLGLGAPQRIMLETRNGPLVLHSFLNTQQPQAQGSRQGPDWHRALLEETRGALRPLTASTYAETDVDGEGEGFEDGDDDSVLEIAGVDGRTMVNGMDKGKVVETGETEEDEEETVSLAPMLIGTVVAPRRENLGEARRAAAGLERIGTRFQREWIKEQQADKYVEEGEQDDG